MTDVQTVLGPVPGEQLGVTLGHEHLFVGSAGLREAYPWLFDGASEVEHAAAELREAHAAGVRTIVDVTTPDLGRAPELMRQAAAASDVHVVAATGIWLDVPRALRETSAEEFAAIFAHEIEEGLGGTDIRAGVIKVANAEPPGMDAVQERILRGAAQAAIRTRVPVTTHTGPYGIGREQIRIFADEGVPPELVAIGHSFTGDVDYLREVLEGGYYLSVDHFRWRRDIEAEVLTALAQLCSEGHAARIMLGHDHAPEQNVYRPHGPHESPSPFGYVLREVRPKLEALGVSAADLDAMLVTAPRAFLEGGRP
ncbi:MAG: TatD family hydrolase [Chloroflexi bacterium]|nr:TatD family hydrolase [Chloroflexota bacterium]